MARADVVAILTNMAKRLAAQDNLWGDEAEALDMVIAAHTPDPDTGLMKCGCGGVPIECGAETKSEWRYKCQVCGIKTKAQPNNAWAIDTWNTAMSGRADNG